MSFGGALMFGVSTGMIFAVILRLTKTRFADFATERSSA
jgi:hypothetical protein